MKQGILVSENSCHTTFASTVKHFIFIVVNLMKNFTPLDHFEGTVSTMHEIKIFGKQDSFFNNYLMQNIPFELM